MASDTANTPRDGGQADPRAQRRKQQREMLLRSALELLEREGPRVSMAQLAAEAGVAKPILYRHFDSQAGLVAALSEHFVAQVVQSIPHLRFEDPRADLRELISGGLRVIEASPSLFEYILVHQGIGVGTSDAQAHLDPMVQWVRQILKGQDLDADLAEPWSHGVAGMMNRTLLWWVRSRSMDRERLVDVLVGMLWGEVGSAVDRMSSKSG